MARKVSLAASGTAPGGAEGDTRLASTGSGAVVNRRPAVEQSAGRRVHLDAVGPPDLGHLGAEFQFHAVVDGRVGNGVHDLPESAAR